MARSARVQPAGGRADGVLRVIELGDGQVSDRAATTAAYELVAAILADPNSYP